MKRLVLAAGLALCSLPVYAASYKAKCVTESERELKEAKVEGAKATAIANSWCDCFIADAVKGGIKDTDDDMETFFETPKGKELEKVCDKTSGWDQH